MSKYAVLKELINEWIEREQENFEEANEAADILSEVVSWIDEDADEWELKANVLRRIKEDTGYDYSDR